ncbi:hypothetical protein MYAM1_000144 [Malassezia yamatoensis]|uniref:Prokaryotic-type class I peptide chain release factors domain-containing protein n=1 Tax=Malassezia yamatoensis TaxID=253288 RepID=A0AAJ5YRE6_9BASI|nr:hypothetical protein MYAM1_000144 [Malassezia yamatoensis]
MLLRAAVRFGHRPWYRLPSLRSVSTLRKIDPSPNAPREVPTPLLFIASPQWAGSLRAEQLFAEILPIVWKQGYTALLLDIDIGDEVRPRKALDRMESEMMSMLRNPTKEVGMIPFPPALIAYGPMCPVAEKYASSWPLTALQLIDPPLSMKRASIRYPKLLGPKPLPEFTFEPKFPARVVWTYDEFMYQGEQKDFWLEKHRIEFFREEQHWGELQRYTFASLEEIGEDTVIWLEEDAGVAQPGSSSTEAPESSGRPARRGTVPAGTVPEWFSKGNYVWAKNNSRKMPILLDPDHLSERFNRGSGPGGQAINKLSIKVDLMHEPTGVRVTSQASRSRELNRLNARRILSQRLEWMIKREWDSTPLSKDRASVPSVLQSKWDKERKKKQNKRKKQRKKSIDSTT